MYRCPTPVSVLISAAVFALAHLTPGEFPQLFILGNSNFKPISHYLIVQKFWTHQFSSWWMPWTKNNLAFRADWLVKPYFLNWLIPFKESQDSHDIIPSVAMLVRKQATVHTRLRYIETTVSILIRLIFRCIWLICCHLKVILFEQKDRNEQLRRTQTIYFLWLFLKKKFKANT